MELSEIANGESRTLEFKKELPVQAIRELIVNAVIHRNYMMSSSVQVAVYDDRVEISSPGSLYGSLTLEEALAGRSSIRNKILASVCEKLNVIEGWGTGLKRIIDLCKEKNVEPPVFEEIGDLLRVNFYRPSYKNDSLSDSIKGNDSLNDSLNDRLNDSLKLSDSENKVLSEIRKDAKITILDLVSKTNLSEPTVNRTLKSLKEKNVLKREGSKKDGFWKVEN